MSRPTYVVATSYDDAATWCQRNRIPTTGRDHRIITDPREFRGLRIPPTARVVIVGAISVDLRRELFNARSAGAWKPGA